MKIPGRIETRPLVIALTCFIFLLGSLWMTALQADDADAETDDAESKSEQTEDSSASTAGDKGTFFGNNQDPEVMLSEIKQNRKTHKVALFQKSPLKSLHDATANWSKDVYEKTNVNLGTSIHHLFQWLTDTIPGEDDWGTATDVDIIARWDALNRGEPNQSSITFHLESRHSWGTTGPQDLGVPSLGMLGDTGNSFNNYVPTSLIRNFYWQTGTSKSKGAIRAGKVTVDSIFGVTAHLTPNNACMSYVCTGAFSIALPDSGLGVVGAWHINDRFKILGGIADANADRYNWGDIGEGDFFKAIDFNIKIWPLSPKAGYSRFTLWQTDATESGSNAALGPKGWGYHIIHEQELSRDGSLVSIWRYGRSMKGSAFFQRQASVALVKNEPSWFGTIDNDAVGIAFSYVKANVEGSRSEKELELWYLFPFWPEMNMSLHYQGIFDPALNFDNDYASAWSIRLTTSF